MKNLKDSRSELIYGSVGVITRGLTAVEVAGLSVVGVRTMLLSDLEVMMDKAHRSSDGGESGEASSEGGLPLSRLLGMAG